MDFSWLAELILGLPPESRFVALVGLMALIWKVIDLKYIQPRTNGNGAKNACSVGDEIKEQVDGLELYLTNHLTTEVENLTNAVKGLTVAVAESTEEIRNMVEQTNRSVNTMNVVLGKIDDQRESIIRLEARMGI